MLPDRSENRIEIDLNRLPEPVRKELLDFYEFLLLKYSLQKNEPDAGVDFGSFIETQGWSMGAKLYRTRDDLYERVGYNG